MSAKPIQQDHLVEGACDDSSELYKSESAGTKVSLPEDELDVTLSRASKYSTLGSLDCLQIPHHNLTCKTSSPANTCIILKHEPLPFIVIR